jgi:hypothetical protein
LNFSAVKKLPWEILAHSHEDYGNTGCGVFERGGGGTKLERFLPKGQIMSEGIYEIIDFPKYHQKN